MNDGPGGSGAGSALGVRVLRVGSASTGSSNRGYSSIGSSMTGAGWRAGRRSLTGASTISSSTRSTGRGRGVDGVRAGRGRGASSAGSSRRRAVSSVRGRRPGSSVRGRRWVSCVLEGARGSNSSTGGVSCGAGRRRTGSSVLGTRGRTGSSVRGVRRTGSSVVVVWGRADSLRGGRVAVVGSSVLEGRGRADSSAASAAAARLLARSRRKAEILSSASLGGGVVLRVEGGVAAAPGSSWKNRDLDPGSAGGTGVLGVRLEVPSPRLRRNSAILDPESLGGLTREVASESRDVAGRGLGVVSGRGRGVVVSRGRGVVLAVAGVSRGREGVRRGEGWVSPWSSCANWSLRSVKLLRPVKIFSSKGSGG